jgi:hypothetical protein
MDTNTFSLEEIRRELARLGYDGASKQTLIKFQRDLEDIARNEKNQSIHNRFVFEYLSIGFFL